MRLGVASNTSKVGLGNRLVVFKREHQRDVDVDALSGQRLNSRNACEGGGHLDHDVRASRDLPEMPGFGDGGFSVVGGAWRDFETDEAVCAFTVVVHRSKDISRHLDVLDDQAFDERSIAHVAFSTERAMQPGIVVGAAGNRFVEDRRVAGHAAQAVLINQSLQPTASDQAAADMVQPDELATLIQSEEWVHKVSLLCEPAIPFASFVELQAAGHTLGRQISRQSGCCHLGVSGEDSE